MNESRRLFVELQPPDGGLQRLQRTIDQRAGRTHVTGWRLAAGTLAMSLLVLMWQFPGMLRQHRQTTALMSAMRKMLAPPADGIRVVGGAAIALPSDRSDVRLYLVQTMPSASPVQPPAPE